MNTTDDDPDPALMYPDDYDGAGSGGGLSLSALEAVARNCSLRLEHIEALNSSDTELISRLYNMCEHTWDPAKTWHVYYWNELIPPLVVYS